MTNLNLRGFMPVSIGVMMFVLTLFLPSAVAAAETASPASCVIHFDTLSKMFCQKESRLLASMTNDSLVSANSVEIIASPTPTATPKPEFNAIREVKGVKKEYLYTDRVTKDKDGWYTKLRSKPAEDSKRGDMLRQGDSVRVLKRETKDWYFVQVFASKDSKLEGKEGWIERWIIDNENVPPEPTATPTPTETPKPESGKVEGASTSSNSEKRDGESSSASESGHHDENKGDTNVSSDGDALFNMINDYRSQNGLPKFEKLGRLCDIAKVRAPEIAAEVQAGTIHSGFRARGYGYPVAVENAAGYGNIQANFNWWLHSSLHRGSILGKDLKYACIECSGGNCVQEFSPNQ